MSSLHSPGTPPLASAGSDSISAFDPQFTTVTGRQGSIPATTAGTVFTLNPGEIGYICNASGTALLVKLGTGAAANSYDFIVAQNQTLPITTYIGPVSVFAAVMSYTAWKLN